MSRNNSNDGDRNKFAPNPDLMRKVRNKRAVANFGKNSVAPARPLPKNNQQANPNITPNPYEYQTHTLNRAEHPQLRTNDRQPLANSAKPAIPMPTSTLKDSRGVEYCTVPKGNYFIGLENDVETIRAPYAMGRFPVTKDEYMQFVIEEKISYSAEEIAIMNKIAPYSNSPAVMVSWDDAKSYCRWLRKKTGDYYALPSIMEWEAAGRGQDGRIYPWGQVKLSHSICCYDDEGARPTTTCTVDYFMNNVSPFGCIGMVGNVMEWTLDSFHDERDPHILKGGSWMSTVDFCNSVTPIISYPPEKRMEFVGFRLLYLPKEMYREYKLAHT